MIPLPFQCLQRLFPGDYTSFRVNCGENASGNNRDRYVWSIPLILNLQLERHTHALQMIIICELNLCPGAPQRWLRRRLLDWLLWINEVILPLIKICVEASTVLPSTWHYTLQPHAANLELFPWILQKKKQQSKAVGFLSWEIKLVHAAHTEKGRVLVRSKGPNDHFSKQEGEENRTSRAAVWRNAGSVLL